MYICMYVYVCIYILYGLVFCVPSRNGMGPQVCKLFAAFLRSSLSFTRYMLPFGRPTSYTYSLKVPTYCL